MESRELAEMVAAELRKMLIATSVYGSESAVPAQVERGTVAVVHREHGVVAVTWQLEEMLGGGVDADEHASITESLTCAVGTLLQRRGYSVALDPADRGRPTALVTLVIPDAIYPRSTADGM